jgi:agmatine deiminase
MITDAQTDFVYFSELLKDKHSNFVNELTKILNRYGYEPKFLKNTNDIWCRDYMPVQVSENKFIEYRYDPDYLLDKKGRRLKTYPDIVCDSLNLKTIKSDLILDGGNVIKWIDKVILTDKIIPENSPKYLKAALIDKLKELFEVNEIILIPWYPKEEFGHADGMIRFIDGERVLVDGYYQKSKPDFWKKFKAVLTRHNLKPEELKFNVHAHSSKNWGYINFLQMKDLLLIPKFGVDEDEQALEQFKEFFPEYAKNGKIAQIDASEIIKGGGVLNCISWNIKKSIQP